VLVPGNPIEYSLMFMGEARGEGENNQCGQEPLLKGKAQYSRPPSANLFSLVTLNIRNIINLFYKTCYLNKEAKGAEPSSSVSVSLSLSVCV
jgi:hypothetical protein